MSAFDQGFLRSMSASRLPYADFIGTTSATLNTAGLTNHGLRSAVGAAVAPSRVMLTVNAASAPAGFAYENAAAHTATQCDIRATGASVPYRGRAWL